MRSLGACLCRFPMSLFDIFEREDLESLQFGAVARKSPPSLREMRKKNVRLRMPFIPSTPIYLSI